MPSYSFECENKNCKESFELFQHMSEDPIKECPECNQNTLRRLIGAGGGALFKGNFPGKDIRRKREDSSLFNKAKVARRLKNSGKIPKDAHVDAKDVDLDKYHGPPKLPANHPERGASPKPSKNETGLE